LISGRDSQGTLGPRLNRDRPLTHFSAGSGRRGGTSRRLARRKLGIRASINSGTPIRHTSAAVHAMTYLHPWMRRAAPRPAPSACQGRRRARFRFFTTYGQSQGSGITTSPPLRLHFTEDLERSLRRRNGEQLPPAESEKIFSQPPAWQGQLSAWVTRQSSVVRESRRAGTTNGRKSPQSIKATVRSRVLGWPFAPMTNRILARPS